MHSAYQLVVHIVKQLVVQLAKQLVVQLAQQLVVQLAKQLAVHIAVQLFTFFSYLLRYTFSYSFSYAVIQYLEDCFTKSSNRVTSLPCQVDTFIGSFLHIFISGSSERMRYCSKSVWHWQVALN